MTAPVFIVSTGRCGSTLMSSLVNLHPDLLSVSEFLASMSSDALRGGILTGEEVYRRYSVASPAGRALIAQSERVPEMLYAFGPDARFTKDDVPPLLVTTLPHLTKDHEALWDEIGPVVRARGPAPLPDHYRFLFEWLCARFGKKTWVERSGASLLLVPQLREMFPDARFVHVYRDGRSTALSMFNHDYFRLRAGGAAILAKVGIDAHHPFNLPGVSPWMPTFEALWFHLGGPERLRTRDVPIEAFGRFWSGMIARGLKHLEALPADRVLSMRYEDLVASPRQELERFARFVGPDFARDSWLDEASAVPNAGSVGWAHMSPEALESLTEACEPGNSLLGYTARRPVREGRDAIWGLSRVRLLSHLDRAQIKRLVKGSTLELHAAGARLLTEGEPGDAMFLVESGHVQVFREGPDGEVLVAEKLGPGDHFGEVALLRGGGVRNASVRAHSDVVLRRITYAAVQAVLDADDVLKARLLEASEVHLRAAVVRRSELVRALDRSPVALSHRDLRKGEVLVRKGDPPGDAFVVIAGCLTGTSDRGDVEWRAGEGSCVGERSMLEGNPRTHTIVAETDARVLVVDGRGLRELVSTTPEWSAHVRALRSVYALPKLGFVTQFSGEADGADTVATLYHLEGGRRVMATRVVGRELFTIDDAGDADALRHVVWTRGEDRRELRLDAEGRIRGALVQGPWSALGGLVRRVLHEEPLAPDVVTRFPSTGSLDRPTLRTAVVCSCLVVPEERVRACIAEGAADVASVRARLGCGSVCGGCLPRVAELLGEEAWTPVRLTAREELVPGVFRLELSPTEGARAPALAGQHLVVRGNVRGTPVQRSYTLTRAEDPRVYEIAVKREPGGVFSGWLTGVDLGAELEVAAPAGEVTLRDAMRSVVCLVAGIGVTPAVAMAREAVARGLPLAVHVDLSASRPDAFAFGAELAELSAAHPRLTVNLRATTRDGRLASADVADLARRFPEAHVFVCGPDGYRDDVLGHLAAAGVPAERVHVEVFTPTGDRPGTDSSPSSSPSVAAGEGWGPGSTAFAPARPPTPTLAGRMGKAVLGGIASVGRTPLGGMVWRALGGLDARYDTRLPVDPTGAAGALGDRLSPHILRTFAEIGARYPVSVPADHPAQPDGNTFVLVAPSPAAIEDAPVPAGPGLPKLGRTVAIHVVRGPAAVRAVLEDVETFDREGYVHHYQQQGVGAEGALPPGHAPAGLAFGPIWGNETWTADRASFTTSVTSGWLDRGAALLPAALAPVVRALEERVASRAAPFDAHVFTTRLAMRMNLAVLFGLEQLDALDEAALPLWSLSREAKDLVSAATRGLVDAEQVRRVRAPARDALARILDLVRDTYAGATDVSPLVRSMVEGPRDEAAVQRLFPLLFAPLLAAQEAEGASLAWALYVLGKQPGTRARVVAEIDAWRAVHGDEPVGLVAQHARPITLAFLFEVQRRYPPMQQTVRVARRDGEMPPDPATGRGAFRYGAGASFFVSMAAVNRCERWWDEPDRFDLDRFLEGVDPAAPPAEQGRGVRANARRWEEAGHYLPFGRGPGTCVGRGLSQVEGVTFLDTLLSRFEFPLARPDAEIDQIDVGPPPGSLAITVRERPRA